MKTYNTNCTCPRCGSFLKTSDVEGYVFVCLDCDENFYGIEISNTFGQQTVEVELPNMIPTADIPNIEEKLVKLAEKVGANSYEYNEFFKCAYLRWNTHKPSAKQIQILANE